MDFIISLAHFCEVHGPTSILCTQVQSPHCETCFPTRLRSTPTPPTSSHGSSTPYILRHTPAASPQLASPTDTPPSSPRSPMLTTACLATIPANTDSCLNCAITFPKSVTDSLSTSSNKRPPLRSTESVLVANPTHTHTLTYLSSRTPSLPTRYATLRQSCVRTLSCELVPAQTGPMMFGDPLAGYTIAFVFRLSDPLARGGKRTYALLCLSPQQSPLITQWAAITTLFQNIVHEITQLAAEKQSLLAANSASSSPSPNASVASRGPEGFLRRRHGAEEKQSGLAELCGKEGLFVDLHARFVCLLSHLTKVYGCVEGGSAASSVDGRSRAGSVCSDDYGLRR